jgi:hydroxyacylglutathione hydrolase
MAKPEKLWAQAKLMLGKVAELYEEPVPLTEERIIAGEDGMRFDLGNGVELMAVETLGHASHHQSYFEKKSRGVFPGDAAGIYIPDFDVIVPTTPPPFFMEATLASIEKLKLLNPKLLFYSHFGPAAGAVEKLQAHADQLRLWAEVVAEKIGEEAGLEKMKEAIERRDPALRKVKDYIAAHPVLGRGAMMQSISGFAEYLKTRSSP